MNLSPLRFHAVHGRYVEVSSDGSEARNTSEDVLGPGVAFANRPLAIDETICLRLTTPYWPLAELTFGFTWYDPSSLLEAVQSKTWYPILLDIRLEKPNFYISMRSSGELHFWGEGGESSRCVAGVDTNVPVWLVLQLPSVPASVKFVEEITEQPPCGYIYNLLPFYFHEIHGINVKIVGQEAYCKRRTRKSRKGATFTSRPVRVNERVCLRIHGVNEETDIQVGFTNQDPVSWARRSTHVVHKKLIRPTRYWVKLLENHLYKNASNIFFYINSARDISFGVDGQKLGHIPSGVEINSNIWATVVVSGKDVNIGFANAEFRQREHEYGLLVNDSLCCNMAALSLEECSSAGKNEDHTHTLASTSSTSTADTTESKSSECSICSDSQANAVLLPCSHMCTCHECALKLWENELHRHCPICRVKIVKILRIYPC